MKISKKWLLILPSVVSFVLYFSTLQFDFVWDDTLVLNDSIASFKDYSIFFGSGLWKYYRPLIGLFYMLDYSIWGWNPFGYHLTNLLLYIFTVFTVTLLLFKLLLDEWSAFIGGLCYAVLSTHVESVAWISGRTDIISFLFLSLSLLGFLEYIEQKRIIALWLSALFALFSMWGKEVGLAYIFLIPLLSWLKEYKLKFKEFLIVALPIIVYLLFKINITHLTVGLHNKPGIISGGRAFIFLVKPTFFGISKQIIKAIGFYFWRVIWPFNLRIFYHKTLPVIFYYSYAIIYFAFLIISFLKKEKVMAFALSWFLITLLPSLPLIVVYISVTPVADRYLFIPSFSLALLLGYLYQKSDKKVAVIVGVIVFLSAHIYSTVKRIPVWKNNSIFWEITYKQSPNNPLAVLWHASDYANKNDCEKAEQIIRKNIENPHIFSYLKASSYSSLANIKLLKGEFDSTIYYANKSLKIYPKTQAYFVKSAAFLEKYRHSREDQWLDSAEVSIERAISLSPYNMNVRYTAAVIYYERDNTENALEELNFIIENDPYSPHARRAIFLMNKIKSEKE